MSELQQKYCNAAITYGQCGGHKKAERNKWLMNQFEKDLKDSGEAVPSYKEVEKHGVLMAPEHRKYALRKHRINQKKRRSS